MAIYSNTFSNREPDKIAHFNPAPTSFGNKHTDVKVSKTGCYWRDGSPADGAGKDQSIYPCLAPGKVYSEGDAVTCCFPDHVCFGESHLCGIFDNNQNRDKGYYLMYRGGCTAQPDVWDSAGACPQKCLDQNRPFRNQPDQYIEIDTCQDQTRADNVTVFCRNEELGPEKCDHNGGWAVDGYGKDEVWNMNNLLMVHGTATRSITSIPIATKTSSASSSAPSASSSASSATSTSIIMGTPPPNVVTPNSPNPTTIILAVGIPLGLLFFFGMVAVAFVCYRRRNAPEPEQKRRSFTVLNVNHATAQPVDTNSLRTAHPERHAIPGPLSSNPILPLSPSNADLAAMAGTSEISQRPIRTPPPASGGVPPVSISQATPEHNRRSGTPTPWPVSEPFIHAYANPNLNSNRNSRATLRRSHTEGNYLSSPAIDPRNRNSHQSASSIVPFPSYSEPNIGYGVGSGPQFPFYSREVHDKLQQMEYERGLEEYYAAGRDTYRGFARPNHSSQTLAESYVDAPQPRGSFHDLPSQQHHSYRPPSQQFQMYTYGYGRPAIGVGRPQVVEINPRNGSAGSGDGRTGNAVAGQQQGQQQTHSRGESTRTVRNVGTVDSNGVSHGKHQSADAAGHDGAGRGSGNGSGYIPYRSSA
ncbi:hypothetical protein QBC36DRAFT_190899 [Triangularia setosa]|uniref:Uncharacterized protein n=1 Tax=Triangularia setosa TaxID=2587417 RepID=A0AAN6W6A9_9PEZI|nr:hypothetical protein QBC36DRAFT_190899 [Podospora setosa]